jgi:hypothetical protein
VREFCLAAFIYAFRETPADGDVFEFKWTGEDLEEQLQMRNKNS